MKTLKDVPLWVKILVWTPLGLYLYPKHFWVIHEYDLPSGFSIFNGILMGVYVTLIINLIF